MWQVFNVSIHKSCRVFISTILEITFINNLVLYNICSLKHWVKKKPDHKHIFSAIHATLINEVQLCPNTHFVQVTIHSQSSYASVTLHYNPSTTIKINYSTFPILVTAYTIWNLFPPVCFMFIIYVKSIFIYNIWNTKIEGTDGKNQKLHFQPKMSSLMGKQ